MTRQHGEFVGMMPAAGYENPPLVGADGLRADAMPLGDSGYDAMPRNGERRLAVLEDTGYVSPQYGEKFVGVDGEAREGHEDHNTPAIAQAEETLASPQTDPALAGLTGAALARAVLAAKGIAATPPNERPLATNKSISALNSGHAQR
jgi:hypothetical protein